VKWRAVDGKLLLDLGKKAVYSSYTPPGINDTSTAVRCIDYLTAILARLAARKFPSLQRHEGDELRVITVAPSFEGLLSEVFDQIRGSAAGNVAIMARMLSALETLIDLTDRPHRRRAIRDQVQWLAELAGRTIESKHERERLARRLLEAREILQAEPAMNAEAEKV
jgi:uncharacterized membrane protein